MSKVEQEVEDLNPEDAWVKKYEAMPYKELALRMLELREAKAKADAESTSLKAELDVIQLRVIPPRFAAEGLQTITIPGAGRIGLTRDMYCTQKPGLQEALFDFLRENDFGDLIKDNVNASSLKALVKELLEEHNQSLASEDASQATESSMFEEAGAESQFSRISEYLNVQPFLRASITKGR